MSDIPGAAASAQPSASTGGRAARSAHHATAADGIACGRPGDKQPRRARVSVRSHMHTLGLTEAVEPPWSGKCSLLLWLPMRQLHIVFGIVRITPVLSAAADTSFKD